MIEVYPGLFVGSQEDEASIKGQDGWYIVHAAKHPYHQKALGYVERAAPKDHPEYLIALRPGCIILNLIDANDAAYIPEQLIDGALLAIDLNILKSKVLVHCNQGLSRSPTIAMLYLNRFTDRFHGMDYDAAVQEFKAIYPAYAPAKGMADYARAHWKG